MSLVLAGLVFAGTSGALFVGRWLANRRDRTETPREEADPAADADEAAGRAEVEGDVPAREESPKAPPLETASEDAARGQRPGAGSRKAPPRPALDGFVCQLGDVVMRDTGDEAWLAGGLVLSEQLPVAVLYVAPDARHDCAIYARTRPRESIWWLTPIDGASIVAFGEPPSAVEHSNVRYERTRRLPLRPRRIGVGAPDVGDGVLVAEYTSAGPERLLVLKANSGPLHAYAGVELAEGSFEVIPSGDATLDT